MKIINIIWSTLKENNETFLGIITLFVTIVYGAWGLYLAKEQIKLAKKQDSISMELQHVTLLGGMNRLLETVHQIDIEFISLNGGNFGGRNLSEVDARELNNRLEKLKGLFVSEMDNIYLNSGDTLKQLWSLAYSNIGQLNQQVVFSLMNLGKEVVNLNTNSREIEKLDSEHLRKLIISLYGEVFKSVGIAKDYTANKIKEDKIKWGLLDKAGKTKININDFYKQN